MFLVEDVSRLDIPDECPVRRGHPREFPDEVMPPLRNYDYTGLFYDVFLDGRDVHFIGPPMSGFETLLRGAEVRSDRNAAPKTIAIRKMKRCFVGTVRGLRGAERLSLRLGPFERELAVTRSRRKAFRGSKALVAISKNNRLEWIRDWALFHAKMHGVNAVVLYDNASTEYDCDSVLRELKSVPGIDAAVVVRWTMPFGPQRVKSELGPGLGAFGNYAQAAMFEHAKRRFLPDAAFTLNVDIDEFVVTDDGRSVFDHVRAERLGGIIIEGQWIETIGLPEKRPPRCFDFRHVDTGSNACSPKWCIENKKIDMSHQWRNHWIQDLELPTAKGVRHRHMRGLGRNVWRREKLVLEPRDGTHVVDAAWDAAVRSVFEAKAGLMDRVKGFAGL